jgi:hypothetical protein
MKFFIVSLSPTNDNKKLQTCNSYDEADRNIDKWWDKFPNANIDILSQDEFNALMCQA